MSSQGNSTIPITMDERLERQQADGEANPNNRAAATNVQQQDVALQGALRSNNIQVATPAERALSTEAGRNIETWRVLYSEQPADTELKTFAIHHEMAFYTGAWIITRQVWELRNNILANYLHIIGERKGNPKKFRLHDHLKDWFSARGTMKKRCILLRYFHDLRLFSESQWRLLTRGDESLPAHLQLVAGHSVVAWGPKTREDAPPRVTLTAAEVADDHRMGDILLYEVETCPEERTD